jgi:hypothetical protein
MKQNIFDKMNLTSTTYKREDFITSNRVNDISVLYRYLNNIWTSQADDWNGVISPRDFSSYEIGSNGAVFSPMGGLYSSTA